MPRSWDEDGSLDKPKDAKVLRYLLKLVNAETRYVYGQMLTPGQVFVGSRQIEKRLGIPHSTFCRMLKRFETEGKIHLQPLPGKGTLVSILPLMTTETLHGTINHPSLVRKVGRQNVHQAIETAIVLNEVHVGNGTQNGPGFETLGGTQAGTKQERKNQKYEDGGDRSSRRTAKHKPSPLHREITGYWCEQYKNARGLPYKWSGKDGKMLQGLLAFASENFNGSSLEVVKTAIRMYLADTDSWLMRAAFPFSVFANQPQRWLSKMSSEEEQWPRR